MNHRDMSLHPTPGPDQAAKDGEPAIAPPNALDAVGRLTQSRERLAGWLEQDRRSRIIRAQSGWGGALASLPLVGGLVNHPVASLALGALARRWLQRSAPVSAQPFAVLALGAAFSVLRRYPKFILGTALLTGAALLWRRARDPSPPT